MPHKQSRRTRSRFPEKPKNGQHLPYNHRKGASARHKLTNCQSANQPNKSSPHIGQMIAIKNQTPQIGHQATLPIKTSPHPGLRQPRISPQPGKSNKKPRKQHKGNHTIQTQATTINQRIAPLEHLTLSGSHTRMSTDEKTP